MHKKERMQEAVSRLPDRELAARIPVGKADKRFETCFPDCTCLKIAELQAHDLQKQRIETLLPGSQRMHSLIPVWLLNVPLPPTQQQSAHRG